MQRIGGSFLAPRLSSRNSKATLFAPVEEGSMPTASGRFRCNPRVIRVPTLTWMPVMMLPWMPGMMLPFSHGPVGENTLRVCGGTTTR